MKSNVTPQVKRKKSPAKLRDVNSKQVFQNPVLCAQFLRDNVGIPILKDVKPEDIEDVSERYRPYLGTEFESDTVKRIVLRDKKGRKKQVPLFLISLIEHKSTVDYNVSMQLLKYMLCIWLDYGREMEHLKKGCTGKKSFRYPPIIPVVYYEGKAPWTADRHFRDRISGSEFLGSCIPDFTYEVVKLHTYTNEELLERGNEMSLIMLFNKVQDMMDLSEFIRLPKDRLDQILKDTPDAIIDIIASVMEGLCVKIGATEEETLACVRKVKDCRMGYLFENMEKMDIQAERRNTAKAQAEAEAAKENLKKAQEAFEEVCGKAQADLEKAKEAAKEDLIISTLSICKELNATKAYALDKLMKNCNLDKEDAEQIIKKHW